MSAKILHQIPMNADEKIQGDEEKDKGEDINPVLQKEENQDEVNLETANLKCDEDNKEINSVEQLDNAYLQEVSERERWSNKTIVQPCNEFNTRLFIASGQNEDTENKKIEMLDNKKKAKLTSEINKNEIPGNIQSEKNSKQLDERFNLLGIQEELVFPVNILKKSGNEIVCDKESKSNPFQIAHAQPKIENFKPLINERDLQSDNTDYFFQIFQNYCSRSSRVKHLSEKIYKVSNKYQEINKQGNANSNSSSKGIGSWNLKNDYFISNLSKFSIDKATSISSKPILDLRFHNRDFNLKDPTDKQLYIQSIKQELKNFSLIKLKTRQNKDNALLNFNDRLNSVFPPKEILDSNRPLKKDDDRGNQFQESPIKREEEQTVKNEKEIQNEEVSDQYNKEKPVENISDTNNS